ncbi:hypothetical protein [Bifidobacterium moukalabense]|uniref:hypothetical protein n=1 Tax=Bifidobacterium moukalabense TaxID=1333651 RepID=UPI0010F51CCF|nr:hypothetical protein [Bifidobacterium moukalabense]
MPKLFHGYPMRWVIEKGYIIDPSDDNMLNITNNGRKVSLDPKPLDVSGPDIRQMRGGKVQVRAEKIHEIWREHADDRATQLVF